jgi:hypothetical protein
MTRDKMSLRTVTGAKVLWHQVYRGKLCAAQDSVGHWGD